jgi:ribosomal-protein-alanine N-acetyltransferase
MHRENAVLNGEPPGQQPRMLTNRLELVPATVALCDAESRGAAALAMTLGAKVPRSWPPPVFEADDVDRIRGRLIADPMAADWTLHYVLRRAGSGVGRPVLVGVAGYDGPPNADGVVEIGYAIAEEYRRQGYATEAVTALLGRAFADSRVRVVAATTYTTLRASIGVLKKTGFTQVSRDAESGVVRFERTRHTGEHEDVTRPRGFPDVSGRGDVAT